MREMSPLLKVIIVFMLVVNAAFFFWHFNRYQSQPATKSQHSETQPLELISKTTVVLNKNDKIALEPEGPVADMVLSENAREGNQAAAKPDKVDKPYDKDNRVKAWQPTVMPVTKDKAQPAPPAEATAIPARDLQTSFAVTTQVETDAPKEDKPGSEQAADPVMPTAQSKQGPEPATEPSPVILSDTRATICTRFGPLLKKEQADQLLSALQDADIQVRLATGKTDVKVGYWIMLPPFPSTSAAQKGVQILKSQGVKDVAVVGGSDYRNAISLGVFSMESSRDRRLRELAKLGYKPIVKERTTVKDVFWLDVTARAGMNWTDLPAVIRDSVDGSLAAHKCAERPIDVLE